MRYSIIIFKSKNNNIMVKYGKKIFAFPEIWNLDFLKIHNCMITSSFLNKNEILDKINNFKNIKNGDDEDYDCWLRALKHTDSVYVKDICFYYDDGHGDGQNY